MQVQIHIGLAHYTLKALKDIKTKKEKKTNNE